MFAHMHFFLYLCGDFYFKAYIITNYDIQDHFFLRRGGWFSPRF